MTQNPAMGQETALAGKATPMYVGAYFKEARMFKVGDRVVVEGTIKAVDDDSLPYKVIYGSGDENWHEAEDVKLATPSNPIICDPTSPEAKALIGKMVEYADAIPKGWKANGSGVLARIDEGTFPFRIEGGCSWLHIRAVTESHTKKMTVSEVCKALGYDVEIVKDAE